MTRYLHITDLHVSAPQTDDPSRQTDTLATLERMVALANDLSPGPEFIIASGDLTNLGDAASYEALAERMAALRVPVIYAMGNHDKRAPFRAVFPQFGGAPDDPLDHDLMIGDLHVIVLDSSVPGRTSGGLEPGQLAFLRGALGRHPDVPKLIVIHHPPVMDPDDYRVWAHLNPDDSRLLADALAGHDVRMIHSGHIHLNQISLWNGVPVVTAIGQQSTVDVTHPAARTGLLRITEGTGFCICDTRPFGIDVRFVPTTAGREIKTIPAERMRLLK